MRTLVLFVIFTSSVFALPDSPTPKALIPARPVESFWHAPYTKPVLIAEFVAASADTAMTCHSLANGAHEVALPIHTCGQMVLFQIGIHVAAQGTSYLIWKTGHHKLAQVPRLWLIGSNAEGFFLSVRDR